MFKSVRILLSAALVAGAFAVPAHAEEGVKKLGTHGVWTAASFIDTDGSKVCYMSAEPTKQEGKYSKRGKVYAQITHRPGEGSKDVFSFSTGYEYKADSKATLTVDGKDTLLFTQNDTAWAEDSDTDGKIAQSLRKGSKMVVKGVSSRGTETVDTFSLSGSGAAHDAITKECGL
jgi:hypothetical protein